ncbi:hypothetical protein PBI_MANDA_76 [Mycobacterium phage Manda]|nr:hypothetical protein PBI_MANDA_76 [Mycobacterium phage Manda]
MISEKWLGTIKKGEEALKLIREGLAKLSEDGHPDAGILRTQLRRLECEFRDARDDGSGDSEYREILELTKMVSERLK